MEKNGQEFPACGYGEVNLDDISSDIVGEDKQKELIEKFDSESSTRNLTGLIGRAANLIAIAMALFHLYTSAFGLLDTLKHRAIHLSFLLVLGYLMYPASRKKRTNSPTVMDY
ncbi:MAG: hypothetical protein LBS93_04515, partial [Synergistaceae bacterium]|nr:hypothetical protein [Synergistaceae bacterium]